MSETGLFLFPWDLHREGVDYVMDFAAESGIRTLYLATSYHAGRFLYSHGPRPVVHTLEDGVVYFHPQAAKYGDIQPRVAAMAREADWLDRAARRVEAHGLRLASWLVCFHNTALGRLHPDAVMRNAFDDPYDYALCPSDPRVQDYIEALIADHLRYPLHSILLEAFRYMDAVHGEHHERWSIPLPDLERSLLGLSFAPTDLAAASAAGLDGARVRRIVRRHLERFFASYPDVPGRHPVSLGEFAEREPEVRAYRDCLVKTLDDLLLRAGAAPRRAGVELIGQGLQEFNITCSPDHPSLDGLLASGVPSSGKPAGKRTYTIIRTGFGEILGIDQLRTTVEAARRTSDGMLFYNYGETPSTVLGWLRTVLDE